MRMSELFLTLIRNGLLIFLLTQNMVHAIAGRCYLCSRNNLAECAGGMQPGSSMYEAVLLYYTEPCNGQCILFRNDNSSTIRGCSWTYGHMDSKPTGWHELSPGILAYFCDTYLCNNGTFEQPEILKTITEHGHEPNELIPSTPLLLESFFPMPNYFPNVLNFVPAMPPINTIPRQLRQCYSCTARLDGCGEFLDPRFVAQYIRPCSGSCIIFRNPSDQNMITRDCASSWPQANVKTGLDKMLGSDAFFCQESLCNGINFDFIMGIFHNQLPAVITFPPSPSASEKPADDNSDVQTSPEEIAVTVPVEATDSIGEENTEVEEDYSDYVMVNTMPNIPLTTPTLTSKTITSRTKVMRSVPTTMTVPVYDLNVVQSTTPVYDDYDPPSAVTLEHFNFMDGIWRSSTIAGGMAVAQDENDLNWWDLDDSIDQPITIKTSPMPSTTTVQQETNEDSWIIFRTTTLTPVTRFEQLSIEEEANFDESEHVNDHNEYETNLTYEYDMAEEFATPSTPPIDSVNTNHSLLSGYFTEIKPQASHDGFMNLLKPIPTLAMPPFSWMLSQLNRTWLPSTTDRPSTAVLKMMRSKLRIDPNKNVTCSNQQCQHGGRMSNDCHCICLPAFSGSTCEIVHCDKEPAQLCNFLHDNECKSDYVRYLCPKVCQTKICSSRQS